MTPRGVHARVGQPFPAISVPIVHPTPGGDAGGNKQRTTVELGRARLPDMWRMVVVFGGYHCELSRKYLASLEEMRGEFECAGVDVLAVSADTRHIAQQTVQEWKLSLVLGYGLSEDDMRALKLYVSPPNSLNGCGHPFPEPGVFVIRPDNTLVMVDISSSPFVRPDLHGVLRGIKYIQEHDFPGWGTL